MTLRALTVYFSNLRNSNFQGFMTFVLVCGLLWTGLSMSFLKICLLCQNLLIFTNILIMILLRETASLGHIIHYCITLRPNTHSQLQTLLPIFHSHHTPTKLTSKAMFGNFFFPLFFIFKNNFLFLRLKNLFGNSKWTENKNCF